MCVFTDKKYIKYASIALVPIMAINTYVGYKIVKVEDALEVEQIDTVIEEVINSEDLEYTFDIGSSDGIVTGNINSNVFEVLLNTYRSSGKKIEDILSNVSKDDSLYASALYARLKEFSLLDDVIKSELENIICFGTQATCVSEEKWNSLFGNLLGTVGEYDNVIDYYYPLASYVHRYSCDLEHEPIFFDEARITCSNIVAMYNEKNPQIDYRKYFTEMIYATDDMQLISKFKRIEKLDSFDEAINELESIYQFASVYEMLDNSLKEGLFVILPNTINSDEDLFDTYYELAYYFHSLWCDLEHTMDLNGRYECVDYSLTLEK